MLGLGTLLLGTALIGSAIKCEIENKKAMSNPSYYLKNGTPVFHNRKGQEYINGEKVHMECRIDDYGHSHYLTVGNQTGKIYEDSWNNYLDKLNEEMNKEIENQKKNGNLAYVKYYPDENKRMTTEISTGKIIAKLESRAGVCRKWYRSKNAITTISIEEGDLGIEISQEEFDALNIIGGSHYVFKYTEEQMKKDLYWKKTYEQIEEARKTYGMMK